MKTLLTVFFASDRIYLAVVKTPTKGLALAYINSTETSLDLENPSNPQSKKAINEFENLLDDIPFMIDETYITLPVESVLVSQFPGKHGISEKELKQLISLEIRQSYPTLSPADFKSTVIPLAEMKDNTKTMLGVIISNKIFETCTNIFSSKDLKINNIEISQLNAHSAFLYNYPEHSFKTVVLFGIQGQFIDVSVLQSGKPIYYNLLSFTDAKQFNQIIKIEVNKLLSDYVGFLDAAYFFGTDLNKNLMNSAKNSLKEFISDVGRLNAFRMLITKLDDRTRQYCSRTQHIYPPCIGACLPSYQEKIDIF